jgi:sarcosine dehydrogenase
VKLKSHVHFLGREAMEKQANSRLKKKLACFVCDDPEVVLLGRETILRNGEQVGYLTSGGFGYTVGRPIGLGYVRKPDGLDEDFLGTGNYELVVAQERVPCRISLSALYDPANARVKA